MIRLVWLSAGRGRSAVPVAAKLGSSRRRYGRLRPLARRHGTLGDAGRWLVFAVVGLAVAVGSLKALGRSGSPQTYKHREPKCVLPNLENSMRPSRRAPDELRPVSLERGVVKFAEGSCFVKFGDTHVLVTATLEERLPPWLKGQGRGWVTAEYGMLPRATLERTRREASAGKQNGRTVEIQRLIGRRLRAVVDLEALGERQITIDCDVIQADGGTRTASITGAWVALADCIAWMKTRNMIETGRAARQYRRDLLRHVRRHGGARPRLCRGFAGRYRRQFRHDRRRPHHRGAGAPPRRRRSRRSSSWR